MNLSQTIKFRVESEIWEMFFRQHPTRGERSEVLRRLLTEYLVATKMECWNKLEKSMSPMGKEDDQWSI
jgi:hypothetical protein